MNKCKNCQWHNKPYWSIINPCDVCLKENTNIEIITRWQDPTIEEYQREIERLNNIINELENIINKMIYDGYTDGLTGYFATTENSEFGVRGKILLNKIQELKENK